MNTTYYEYEIIYNRMVKHDAGGITVYEIVPTLGSFMSLSKYPVRKRYTLAVIKDQSEFKKENSNILEGIASCALSTGERMISINRFYILSQTQIDPESDSEESESD